VRLCRYPRHLRSRQQTDHRRRRDVPPGRGASPAGWLVVAYLGVFQIGLAYLLLTAAARKLTALELSLLVLAEPALNPLWALLVHGERPGAWTAIGGALILGATLVRAFRAARFENS
jgi:drug/metabolite transporter (DMT)-like permease